MKAPKTAWEWTKFNSTAFAVAAAAAWLGIWVHSETKGAHAVEAASYGVTNEQRDAGQLYVFEKAMPIGPSLTVSDTKGCV